MTDDKNNNFNEYKPQDIISYWFLDQNKEKWFIKNNHFDDEVREKFFNIYQAASTNELDDWRNSPEGILALILILDQFPRNMFRNLPQSYATDRHALELCKYAIYRKFDTMLADREFQQFLYMPLMHSENKEDQVLSLKLYKKIDIAINYAEEHKNIIDHFGRFPYRNEILGRKSSKEEREFIAANK